VQSSPRFEKGKKRKRGKGGKRGENDQHTFAHSGVVEFSRPLKICRTKGRRGEKKKKKKEKSLLFLAIPGGRERGGEKGRKRKKKASPCLPCPFRARFLLTLGEAKMWQGRRIKKRKRISTPI